MSEIRIGRRTLAAAITALVVSAFLLVPGPRDAAGARARALMFPPAVADAATLAEQRSAAERGITGAHEKAAEQLRKVLELRLAITRAQADVIAERARADLAAIRRSALLAVAQATGLEGGALEQAVLEAEARPAATAEPGRPAVLLAPTLGQIVLRAAELSTQVADAATKDLTGSGPTPAPSPAPRTASPSPSPR